jgi:hypothetical protein
MDVVEEHRMLKQQMRELVRDHQALRERDDVSTAENLAHLERLKHKREELEAHFMRLRQLHL